MQVPAGFTVTIKFKIMFLTDLDCSEESLLGMKNKIQTKLREGLKLFNTRYNGLCGSNPTLCDTVTVAIESCGNRRKRELNNNVAVSVTVTNVS